MYNELNSKNKIIKNIHKYYDGDDTLNGLEEELVDIISKDYEASQELNKKLDRINKHSDDYERNSENLYKILKNTINEFDLDEEEKTNNNSFNSKKSRLPYEDIQEERKRKRKSKNDQEEINSLLYDLKTNNSRMKIKKISSNEIAFDKEDFKNNNSEFFMSNDYDYEYDGSTREIYKDGKLVATVVEKDLRWKNRLKNIWENRKKAKETSNLPDEKIEEVSERKRKISIFSNPIKWIKNRFKIKSEENKNTKEDERVLSIKDKILDYLNGVTYTIKDLIHILEKAETISNSEVQLKSLNEFLDNNKNLKNDEKLVNLVYNMNDLYKNSKLEIVLAKVDEINKFFEEKKFNDDDEIKNLYKKVVDYDNIDDGFNRICTLHKYIEVNRETITKDNLIKEMKKILGIELEEELNEIKEKLSKVVEKTDNLTRENKELKERLDKTVEENGNLKKENKELKEKLNKPVEETKNVTEHKENVPSDNKNSSILSKAYNRYISLQSELDDKLKDLEYIESEIEKLSYKIGTIYEKFGMDIEDKYRKNYVNEYNFKWSSSEKSASVFDKFDDSEMETIYKYMNYTKSL